MQHVWWILNHFLQKHIISRPEKGLNKSFIKQKLSIRILRFDWVLPLHFSVSKMKPLATNRLVLTLFGVFQTDTKWWQKLISISFISTIVLLSLTAALMSLAFFKKYVSIDLEQSLYAIFQTVAVSIAMNALTVIVLSRRKISDMIEKLEHLYGSSKKNHLESRNY